MASGGSRKARAKERKQLLKRWKRNQANSRRTSFQMEKLEDKILLNADPRLISINANSGEVIQQGTILNIAPRDLTFRFDDNQIIDATTLDAIQITDTGADTAVNVGFAGLGAKENEVVVRFADTLTDGTYEIFVDSTLSNTDGDSFGGSITSGGTTFTLTFELDLGAQIVSIVPQPITRSPDGVLTQARNQIVVYFNDDDLMDDLSSAENPNFYQLIFTGDTGTNTDDVIYQPSDVDYSPVSDSAVLTFPTSLDQLGSGAGTFRLRIGDSNPLPLAPFTTTPAADPGDTFSTSFDLGVIGSRSQIVTAGIEATTVNITLPGSTDDPGNRDVFTRRGIGDVTRTADAVDGITTIAYNFANQIGFDPGGNPLFNAITETQKLRVREAFELWGHYLGLEFVETDSSGLQIATGDMRAINRFATGGPGDFEIYEVEPDPTFESGLLVMDNAELWDNGFGDTGDPVNRISYFRNVMAGIGELLGVGKSFHLHSGVVAAAGDRYEVVNGIVIDNGELREQLPGFLHVAEGVFPAPTDVVHGQYMHRPDSIDVDLYEFEIAESGVFTAETLAQRQEDASLLDTSLAIYRQNDGGGYELVARNDDYYGDDSRIRVELQPGTYYIGVSSTGNTEYNPLVEESGFGGTTQGDYDLRLRLEPLVNNFMVDATGTAFDGDADGVPGGVHNFWFRAQTANNTLIVDKSAPDGGTGTLAAPFNQIDTALAASSFGDIVRIVGNGGTDGNLATVGDNEPYQIGFNILGETLEDGSRMIVPRGVTVMIDEGAILKLNQSAIQVGSSTASVDRSNGALQVLGTPDQQVFFTSLNDDDIGQVTNSLDTPPRRGDWGGIKFRNDIDQMEGRSRYEENGIFLNYVNNASIGFGGGVVNLDSIQQIVTPIDIDTARPTVTFNTILNSSDAAMAANPDSFEETNFHAPEFQAVPFTSDYTRIGPEIHGNKLIDNTLNGLFVRVNTPAGTDTESMTVSGRWDDTDIVHIVAENLNIRGASGGAIGSSINPDINIPVEDRFTFAARENGRLAIDSGIVVKADGSRIEVGIGAQLLAEGTPDQNIIFTSINDFRYGAGGTFNTPNSTDATGATEGDWSGIYYNWTSSGSLDHTVVAFGGGLSRIEGSVAGFNALEIHQAEVRVANSLFESNLGGVGGQSNFARGGRGANAPGAIFSLGAQPIIVNNIITDTLAIPSETQENGLGRAAAINVDTSSLDHRELRDYGRSTGTADLFSEYDANLGALIRGNRLGDNDLNGMVVRGGTILTQSVWDDTDIVHAVFDAIYIPNHEHFGGVRLQSNPGESLVVKFSGNEAGFMVTGDQGDTLSRIGGALQVIGQPGNPVVLTSLSDQTVGAGFDPDGNSQTGTDGFAGIPRTQPLGTFNIEYFLGPTLSQNAAVIDALERAAEFWESRLEDPITVYLDAEIEALDDGVLGQAAGEIDLVPYTDIRGRIISDARSHEEYVEGLPASIASTNFVLPELDDEDLAYEVDTDIVITYANAKALGIDDASLPEVVSAFDPDPADPTMFRDGRIQIDDDTTPQEAFETMIHEIGHALGFTSTVDAIDTGNLGTDAEGNPQVFLRPLDLFRLGPGEGAADFTNAARVLDPVEEHVFYDGGIFNPTGIEIAGITLGDVPLSRGENSVDGYQASHWRDESLLRGIYLGLMDPEIDDNTRFTANDARAFDVIGWDVVQGGGIPGEWSGITIDQFAHDGNYDVITELETPSEAGGENEDPNSAEFVGNLAPAVDAGDDVRRLGLEVHGFLGSTSDVDVYSFDADTGTRVWIDLDQTSLGLDSVVELIASDGTVIASSDDSLFESTAGVVPDTLNGSAMPLSTVDFHPLDLYSYNALDAGFNVELPGQPGITGTYYVQVRSNAGHGVYQLQLRLEETDVIPGTTVRYSDIRYADTGIRISGQPNNSQFIGDFVETSADNDAFGTGQDLGQVYVTESGGVSIAGEISDFEDIDWYEFQVGYDYVDRPAGGEPVPVILDIDFADGFGGPDTSLWLFDDEGRLVAEARDGSVDLVSENQVFDLESGSGGVADPYLGPIHLFPGTYHVAVTSAQVPDVLGDPIVKREPIDSIRRVVDDHVDGVLFDTRTGTTFNEPIFPQILTELTTLRLPKGSDIQEGETVSVRDPASGESHTYEFTTGVFQVITPSGAATLDGETITVSTNFQSETYLMTNSGFTLEILSSNMLTDGTLIQVSTQDGQSRTYELDSNFNTAGFTVDVPFTPGESPEGVAERLAGLISGNGPVGATAEGRVVRIREAFDVTISDPSGTELISPVPNGEIPVFFDPGMTPEQVATQLANAINGSGLVTAGIAGGSPNRVIFTPDEFSFVLTTDIDLTVGSNFQLNRPVQPGNTPVVYSPFNQPEEVAIALESAIAVDFPLFFSFFEINILSFPNTLDVSVDADSKIFQTSNSATDLTLADIPLFVTSDLTIQPMTQASVWTIDAYSGELETSLGAVANPLGDVIIRDEFSEDGTIDFHDDHLFSLSLGPPPVDDINDGSTGHLIRINPGTAASEDIGDDGIQTFQFQGPGSEQSDVGMFFQAMAARSPLSNSFFAIGHRGDFGLAPGVETGTNCVYQIDWDEAEALGAGPDREDPDMGAGRWLGCGTQTREFGSIDTLAPQSVDTTITLDDTSAIADGMLFTLDVAGTTYVFEFNSGPEAVVEVDFATGQTVQDEDLFTIDGQRFTFDTGAVLAVNTDASGFRDGDILTITDTFNLTQTFEFDSDGSVTPGRTIIPFSPGLTQGQMASVIVGAVNAAPFAASAETLGNRITLRNDVDAETNAPGLGVEGNFGVTDGIRVPVEETLTAEEIAAVVSAVANNAGIEASFAGARINFPGSNISSFAGSDVMVSQGSSGSIAAASDFAVPFGAGDTPDEFAARISDALNASGVITSTSFEGMVLLTPGSGTFVSIDGGIAIGGAGPGGIITGMDFDDQGRIIAVSDMGGLFTFGFGAGGDNYVATSTDLLGIPFTGMTRGPSGVDGGRYADIYFGIDAFGILHAFDENGTLQPIFANGEASIQTGIIAPSGIIFSTLEENLWHITGQDPEVGEVGHGIPIPITDSRPATTGGGTFHFGTTSPRVEERNYDYSGGAQGSLITNTFSLTDYTAGDNPVLTFNYWLETEGTDFIPDRNFPMRDSFRVFISSTTDPSAGEWHLLATNNSTVRGGQLNDEFDDPNPDDNISIGVAELFDNTGQWRQARINLESFVGMDDLQLKFEFATGGGIDFGSPFSQSFAGAFGDEGEELRVIAGSELRDGNVVDFFFGEVEFEFGHTLVLPTGSRIPDGEVIQLTGPNGVSQSFEFDRDGVVGTGNILVGIDDSMSANRVTTVLKNAILSSDISREQNDPIATLTGTLPPPLELFAVDDRLNLPNVVGFSQVPASGASQLAVFVDGDIGVEPGRIPASVNIGMSASQVAAVMEQAIADAIFDGNTSAIIRRGSVFKIPANFSVIDPGPLFLATSQWGEFTSAESFGDASSAPLFDAPDLGRDDGSLTGIDNDFEGVYIDDIIIGFTEHGEAVTADDGDGAFGYFDVPINTSFTPVIQMNDSGGITDTRILDGRYHLEIRQGPIYGIPTTQTPALLLGRDFDTNEPIGDGTVLTTTIGSAITNGQTFSLGTATFEFVDSTIFEENDTIPDAYRTDLIPGSVDTFVGIGAIGDNRNGEGDTNIEEQGLDVDIVAFDLLAGDILAIDVDSANPDALTARPSRLDSHVRVFDELGNLIVFNSETAAPGDRLGDAEFLDPSLVVTAQTSGTYYVAISFEGNEDYDPFVSGSGTAPATSFVEAAGGGSYQLTARLNGGSAPGENILVHYSTADSAPDIADRIVDAVQRQDRIDISLAPRGLSNIVDVYGDVTGTTATYGNAVESNDTLATALDTGLIAGNSAIFQVASTIGDNPEFTDDPGKDVDVYKVNLAASEKLTIDVDGLSIGSSLDAMVRVFDASGVQFAEFQFDTEYDFDTDFWYDPQRPINANGIDEELEIDPFAVFAAPFSGDYFVAVSGNSNETYNPTVAGSGRSFFGSDKGRYELTLTTGDGGLEIINTEGRGQDNLERNQGQLVIAANQVRFSQNQGIVVEGASDEVPIALRNLISAQTTSLVPGVTIVNNVVARNGGGGIRFSGSPNQDPVPFGRILNNTVVGTSNSAGFVGTGIEVADNAGPTLLNNIVAENAIGISVDGTSTETVNVASLYKNNDVNVTGIGVGDFAILLRSQDPLFVNSENDNFVPTSGSLAIDSSVASLADRDALVAARASIGIPVSPIVVPETDVTGQLRIDDPLVNTPDGQGANVFIDRGAFDAADKAGPLVRLTIPVDNGSTDTDPADGSVVTSELLTRFEMRLFDTSASGFDTGIGIDDTTVTPEAITLTQDGVALEVGIDYRFGYDAASNLIRLTPIAGVWDSNATYNVTFDNTVITDLAGNPLRPNQLDGSTQLTIVSGLGRDYGDAPSNYPVLESQNGASHGLVEGFFLGAGATSEGNGQPSPTATADGFDDGVDVPTQIVRGGVTQFSVTASAEGRLSAWADWNSDGDWNDPGEQFFNGVVLSAGTNLLPPTAVPADVAVDTVFARFRFSSSGNLLPTGPADDGEVEDYRFNIVDNPWQNPVDPEDVNNNGVIQPLDALLIINELNDPQFSDPSNGALPVPPPISLVDGPYLDVNGDGFASPIDALLVINQLNSSASSALSAGTGRVEEEDDSFWAIENELDFADEVTDVWGQDGLG